jgi:hypothetical protein
MNFKTAAAWAFLIFTIGAVFYVFIRPVFLPPKISTIAEGDLVPAGEVDGEKQFYKIQSQIEWGIDQLIRLIPSLTAAASAWYFRGKKEDRTKLRQEGRD